VWILSLGERASQRDKGESRSELLKLIAALRQATDMMLGAVKDGRLRATPLRNAFGILDRPCAPCPPESVGTESVPTIDRASGGSNRKHA